MEYLKVNLSFDTALTSPKWQFSHTRLSRPVSDERPIKLFDECTHELVRRRVVLPGATTLARLVVEVRERVATRLYRDLARRLDEGQRQRLGELLLAMGTTGTDRRTPFDRLRTPPTRVSAPALVVALERIEAIRSVGVSEIRLEDVPQSRLDGLCKYAAVAWPRRHHLLTGNQPLVLVKQGLQALSRRGREGVAREWHKL